MQASCRDKLGRSKEKCQRQTKQELAPRKICLKDWRSFFHPKGNKNAPEFHNTGQTKDCDLTTVIRNDFYHPDYTVGPGVSPDHAPCRLNCDAALVGFTTDRELLNIAGFLMPQCKTHPAPKYIYSIVSGIISNYLVSIWRCSRSLRC